MVGPKDKSLRFQLGKGGRDVIGDKARAIGTDQNHFVVTESRDFFHRRLEALSKSRSTLFVANEAGQPRRLREPGSEKVKIGRDFRPAEIRKSEQTAQGARESSAGEIESYRFGKNENSLLIHRFGIRFPSDLCIRMQKDQTFREVF